MHVRPRLLSGTHRDVRSPLLHHVRDPGSVMADSRWSAASQPWQSVGTWIRAEKLDSILGGALLVCLEKRARAELLGRALLAASLLEGLLRLLLLLLLRFLGTLAHQDLPAVPAQRQLERSAGPAVSNPVRLGSYVSRAIARREIAGFRPGFWQQGQLNECTPLCSLTPARCGVFRRPCSAHPPGGRCSRTASPVLRATEPAPNVQSP
jgi:hypothetical protein